MGGITSLLFTYFVLHLKQTSTLRDGVEISNFYRVSVL